VWLLLCVTEVALLCGGTHSVEYHLVGVFAPLLAAAPLERTVCAAGTYANLRPQLVPYAGFTKSL
jgi:hypothetical protein